MTGLCKDVMPGILVWGVSLLGPWRRAKLRGSLTQSEDCWAQSQRMKESKVQERWNHSRAGRGHGESMTEQAETGRSSKGQG